MFGLYNCGIHPTPKGDGFSPFFFIIVWGVVRKNKDSQCPDSIEEGEKTGNTHFWVELKENEKIIDIFPHSAGWSNSSITTGSTYYGNVPQEYHSIKKFHYYGNLTSKDLCNAQDFQLIESMIDFVDE